MALLSLENIGKIYVSEGAVAVGIRGVNLSFDAGEFVAITGKSGSGKTTLLNAISGMDSYEEGELYIEGQPTSHYTQADWEAYREKYISFIFQDYNIIDSFTVLQNVELALMYIPSARARRRRALELIDRVGLTPLRHHKGSKLSGGQKQRTVIARALAKDSPIILADEPTGNLDSESAKEVVALLKEVSADKLVIVVTHNFDQFADCATREVRVFDGQIERDERLREAKTVTPHLTEAQPATMRNTLRRGFVLGWHRFRATPRLTTFICFVMLLALIGTFALTSYLIAGGESEGAQRPLFGYAPGRLIVARRDGNAMTDTELRALYKVTNAQRMMQYDSLLDESGFLNKMIPGTSKMLELTYRFSCDLGEITSHPNRLKPDAGELPARDDEVFLYLPIAWEQIYGRGDLKAKDISVLRGAKKLTVTGVKYYYDNTKTAVIYMEPTAFERLNAEQVLNRSNGNSYLYTLSYAVTYEDSKGNDADPWNCYFRSIRLDESLKAGTVTMATYDTLIVKDDSAYTAELRVTKNNTGDFGNQSAFVFRTDTVKIDVARTRELSDKLQTEAGSEILYVSADLWDAIFTAASEGYRQGSLFYENDRVAASAAKTLASLTDEATAGLSAEEKDALADGYFAVTSDAYYTDANQVLINFILTFFKYVAWFFLILFLSLFLTLCYARGMNTLRGDLGILRSMGISAGVIRVATYAQTIYSMTPAVCLLVATAVLIYRTPSTNAIFPFLGPWHYILILFGAAFLCVRIARRYNRKVFSQSVRKTLRGGAAND